jgi:hypothetical protein
MSLMLPGERSSPAARSMRRGTGRSKVPLVMGGVLPYKKCGDPEIRPARMFDFA